MHPGEQYSAWSRRIALRTSAFWTALRLPHLQSISSHDRHQRISRPEIPGGHIASARIDAMIGCAGETSSGRRGDLNDAATWDASSGFHIAPDSLSGGVIVGEQAFDAARESVRGGELTILRFYLRITANAVDGAASERTVDTHAVDTAAVPVELPFVRRARVTADPQSQLGMLGDVVADLPTPAARDAEFVGGDRDPQIWVAGQCPQREPARDALRLAFLRRHRPDEPRHLAVGDGTEPLVEQVQRRGLDVAGVERAGELAEGLGWAGLSFALLHECLCEQCLERHGGHGYAT